jgi:kexin
VGEYRLSLFEKALPSVPSPNSPVASERPSTTTKAHPKPTDHLPGNHGEAEGEADKPAFDDGRPDDATRPSSNATASGTMIPTADEGWFSDMSSLVSNQKWVFGAAGVVLLFGVIAGVFLCRRRRRAARHYSALPGDEVALGAMPRGGGGAPRTKELYDAFGEHDDDDDDVDENTGLRVGSPGGAGPGLAFHEGFLDDEDPHTPRTAPTPAYRDEPEQREAPTGGATSPSGSGSGDGSWVHAP